MNETETRWWRRFERCIKDMPDSLEIVVGHYHAGVLKRGGQLAYFDASRDGGHYGDADNVIDSAFESVMSRGLLPNSEGM